MDVPFCHPTGSANVELTWEPLENIRPRYTKAWNVRGIRTTETNGPPINLVLVFGKKCTNGLDDGNVILGQNYGYLGVIQSSRPNSD